MEFADNPRFLLTPISHCFYNLQLGGMTRIPIKQVHKRINMIFKTISSYLRPSKPNPISLEAILPQELIDLIIDELGSYISSDLEDLPPEFKTLQNCALVSRSFRLRATHWVFFRARLQGRWNDEKWIHKRVDGFLEILVANPSIGGSVCELFIQTSQSDFYFWLQDNAALVSILERLSKIQRFDLQYGLKPFNWEALPSKTAMALRCTIQSPSLRSLKLHDIQEFPWFILAGCSTLKDLEIFRVRASNRHFIVPSAIAPMLESVHIISAYTTTESLFSNPNTAPMFSQLQILNVGFHRSLEIGSAAEFISKVAQTLETLNVLSLNDKFLNDENPLYQIDISRLPALRHLNILRCIIEYHPFGTPQFPSSLCQLLKLRGSTSYIQTIVVHVEYEDVEMGTEQGLFLPDRGWADFDVILADENYRALKKITLHLRIGFIWWNPGLQSMHAERIKFLMDELFPAVKASGRVEIDFVIDIYGNDETSAQ